MFVELEVKLGLIVHGYDQDNKEIQEVFKESEFTKKIVALERIQSISEKYILVKSSHDRVMYWEYKDTMEQLKHKLLGIGINIAS